MLARHQPQALRLGCSLNLIRLFLQDAGEDQHPALLEQLAQAFPQQADQHRRQDIGQHDLGLLQRELARPDFLQRPQPQLQVRRHAVGGGVFLRCLDRLRVDVHPQRVARPQLERRNRQDRRAAAQVDDLPAFAGPGSRLFQGVQAELRGGVGAGAKGHARVDADRDALRVGCSSQAGTIIRRSPTRIGW